MIRRVTDEEDPWQELEEWNQENQIWLFVGLMLVIIPGLFSVLCLGRGLRVPVQKHKENEKVEKEYWISSDTDEFASSSGLDDESLHED
mmetsp:Transcript_10246/g.12644  ORF Transcript_10246/g.12644 Transcript_10246/m.12644 type:complete len:89 (+) Transcript_10246:3-269(+)